jgi:hypothetical protein
LAVCAMLVIIAVILLRLFYAADIPAESGAELEAARRIMGGALPYAQFYSSDLLPLFAYRLLTLVLLPVGALLSWHNQAFSTAIFDINSNFYDSKILGLTSVIVTTNLMLLSMAGIHRVLAYFVTASLRWLFLLAFALANLAMGVEFGQQQHVFVLLALPYLVLRFFEWQAADSDLDPSLNPGKSIPRYLQIVLALVAAFGAGFSLFNLASLLLFELGESIARRRVHSFLTISSKAFWLFSALIWAPLLALGAGQKEALFGWILPVKFMACTHYDYSYYGWTATPERTDLLYAFVVTTIFAYGGILRFAVLRPLVVMALAGLFTWMFFVTGLSCDALALTFFLTLLGVVELYGVVLYLVRTYPRIFAAFSRLPVPMLVSSRQRAATVIVTLAALAFACHLVRAESMQRREAKTLATRLQPQGVHDMLDLENVLSINCKKGERIMIINGHLRPAFPIITRLGLSSTGYFIGTEPFGFLSSLRNGRLLLPGSREANFISTTEKMLYIRLYNDIVAIKPTTICLEGGESEQGLVYYNLYAKLIKLYKRQCEAMYFSDRREPREVSEYNYNYWIYKLP